MAGDQGSRSTELNQTAALPTGDVASDVRLVAKGGALQGIGLAGNRIFQFLFAAVAVRILAADGYGLYRQTSQILGIASTIGLAGFHFGAMRYVSLARVEKRAGGIRGSVRVAIVSVAVLSSVIAGIILVGAEGIASLFASGEAAVDELAGLLRLGVPYVPLFALMYVLAFSTQGYKTVTASVVIINIIQPGARFIAGVIALVAGFAVAGAVVTLEISVALGVLAGIYFYFRMLPNKERQATPVMRKREMLRFSIPQGGASLLSIQSVGVGIIVLGAASTDVQVGLFAVALALQAPGLIFQSAIQTIWAPVVSDLYFSGQQERLEIIFQTITRWLATLSFPFLILVIIESDFFVTLFAGDRAPGAATVASILAAGNLFFTGTGPTGHVISMIGKPSINLINSIFAIVLYFGLGFIVVPEHGAVGMAVVDAGVTVLVNVARIVECKVFAGIQPFGRTFIKPLIASATTVGVLLLWNLFTAETMLMNLVGIALAGAATLGVLMLLGLDPEERLVWNTIRARIRRGREAKSSASEG